MINEIRGDITTAVGLIAHQVNCQGVMGAGVAKAIRQRWPHVYEEYVKFLEPSHQKLHAMRQERVLGKTLFVAVSHGVTVANLFAQMYYGNDGVRYTSYDALDDCMSSVAKEAASKGWNTINFPLIGCGLAGGHWPIVREIIEHRIPDTFTKNLWLYP